jgi:hypothetical protein
MHNQEANHKWATSGNWLILQDVNKRHTQKEMLKEHYEE